MSPLEFVGCILLSASAIVVTAQTKTGTPLNAPPRIVFDVVSVKSNHIHNSHPGPMIEPDGFDAENVTPIWVMYWAFDCGIDRDESRFTGLPAWVKTDRFDIIAKVAGADVASWKALPEPEKERMVRDVLVDRFKLQFHRQPNDRPIYALVVAKGGVKMTRAVVPDSDHVYGRAGYVGPEPGGVAGEHAAMKSLIDYLNGQRLGRVVVDRTGLTGNYDFMLKFTPFPMDASPDDESAPTGSPYPYIFAALEEQLGLKLQPARGPVDTIVIDHMEHPSEN